MILRAEFTDCSVVTAAAESCKAAGDWEQRTNSKMTNLTSHVNRNLG